MRNSKLVVIENNYMYNVKLFFEKANEIEFGCKAKSIVI